MTNGSIVTAFVINPQGSQTLMRIKNGVTNYYIYGAGLVYEIDETAATTNTAFYHTDSRGTTVVLRPTIPDALTPLALRNSRTVSAGTSTACAAGVAFAGPATIAGFNSAMPANLPSPSSAAAPEKPSAGAGDSARSLPLPTGGDLMP